MASDWRTTLDDETAREKAVERTLGVSLSRLTEAEHQRFQELAVFPEDVDVPLNALARFWSLSELSTHKLCKRLHGLALLLRYDDETIRLHDVVWKYLKVYDSSQLHKTLLEGCRPQTGRWSERTCTSCTMPVLTGAFCLALLPIWRW